MYSAVMTAHYSSINTVKNNKSAHGVLLSNRMPIARQTGFTLLEVMVAMFIFAVAGAAIVKTTAEHINSVGKLEEITFATWVANNQLTRATLLSEKTWPLKNNERGSVEMLDRTWYWQQEIKGTNDESLKAVTITVGLDPEYEGSITSVTTYIAKSND